MNEWQYYYYPPYLYHHGILGQKWGIRRFQNSDGTLTEAGRKRYRVDSEGNLVEKTKAERKADAKASRAAKIEQQKQNRLEREQETLEKKKERILASRDPKLIYENKDMFSYQELSDIYNIITKEQQIASLIPKGRTTMDKIRDMSKSAGDIATAVENGSRAYNAITKVTNSLLGTDFPKIEEAKEKESSLDKQIKKLEKQSKYYQTKYLIEQNKENLKNLKNKPDDKKEPIWQNKEVMDDLEKQTKYHQNIYQREQNKENLRNLQAAQEKREKEEKEAKKKKK